MWRRCVLVEVLVEIEDLTKNFPVEGGLLSTIESKISRHKQKYVHALSGVSFSITKGETLGVVGESGSGKSTLGRCILKLIEPTSGKIVFDQKNIMNLESVDLIKFRRRIQMIFQDPFSSLNPRIKIRHIIGEPIGYHRLAAASDIKAKVSELLEAVGLGDEHMDRYPHQFSGGQKQRIAIARALALGPEFIVADEAVSALDVSIQAQILKLLQELKMKYSLTYMFIAHNLDVVELISDRVAVMYLGKIVELADTKTLFKSPAHPYTQALISASPIPNPRLKREKIILGGDVPSAIEPPSGCRFHTRCPYVMDKCKTIEPEFKELDSGHYSACHLND